MKPRNGMHRYTKAANITLNWLEQNSSWEADCHTMCQEVPCFWIPKVHDLLPNSQEPATTLYSELAVYVNIWKHNTP